ncbi:MAG: GNAT family N-acetyltransferase [Planctomycetaceae bacterium]|nr:GNAT family N-acetyltransferase [Planctomycetaceae bacterium]
MNTRTALPVARTKSTRRPARVALHSTPPEIVPAAISAPERERALERDSAAERDGPRLAAAKAGDHQAIHRLLLAAFHGPTPAEFQAQLDEPGYEPSSRLVVRHGDAVAAHLRLSRRTIHLDGLAASAVQVMDLATAAEYRGLGFASSLIAAAERQAREQGVMLGLTRTRAVPVFARQGWAVCGRHAFATAGARQILAHLESTSEGVIPDRDAGETHCLLRQPRVPIAVRPLRRIELPAIMRLYDAALAGRWGWPARREEYWDWLINRGACDRVYVVAEGAETADLSEQLAAIRGYVFVREGRIVELMVEPGRPQLAEHLVARVCADASEQDHWQVRLDAAPDDPLHHLFHQSGGRIEQAEEIGGEVFMAKVFDPLRLLVELEGVLVARHRAAALPKPLALGLEIQCGAKIGRTHAAQVARLRLVFTSRGMKLVRGPVGRQYLTLRKRDLAPLLLGHWHLSDMVDAGRIEASTKTAVQVGRALFPKLPWWRPPLDDLLAPT